MNVLGFIGGSGIYKLEFLTDIKEHQIKSSFGDPSGPIIEGKIDNNTVFFYLAMEKVILCHHLPLTIVPILIV